MVRAGREDAAFGVRLSVRTYLDADGVQGVAAGLALPFEATTSGDDSTLEVVATVPARDAVQAARMVRDAVVGSMGPLAEKITRTDVLASREGSEADEWMAFERYEEFVGLDDPDPYASMPDWPLEHRVPDGWLARASDVLGLPGDVVRAALGRCTVAGARTGDLDDGSTTAPEEVNALGDPDAPLVLGLAGHGEWMVAFQVGVDAGGLAVVVGPPIGGWRGPGELVYRVGDPSSVLRSGASEVQWRAAVAAASAARRETFETCQECGRSQAPEHGGELCHRCLSDNHGVRF